MITYDLSVLIPFIKVFGLLVIISKDVKKICQ